MPRPKRLHTRNAIYHTLSRGNRKSDIFLDNSDKRIFCHYLKSSLERFDHSILAFCLMNNHFHLAIKVHTTPLESIMHQLLSRYSKYFNAKYELVGHCFQGRYTSKCVQDESYLFDLCKYIHLNPVRAGLVKSPADHPWSSHHSYLGSKWYEWVNIDELYSRISKNHTQARKRYLEFISCESDYPKEILFYLNNTISDDLNQHTSSSTTSLIHLIQLVADEYKQPPQRLIGVSHCKKRSEARAVIGYLAKKHKVCSISHVAAALHRAQPTISQAIQRLEGRLNHNEQLLNLILKLEKSIN